MRLRPYTDHLPKALVPVAGRPIIDHVVNYLAGQGLSRLHLCVGYKGDLIREHFAVPRHGIGSVSVSDLAENASMLRRLHEVSHQIGERMLVAYCDTFVDIAVEDFVRSHRSRAALVSIVTAPIRNPFGVITFGPDGVVDSFREKPVNHHFIGMMLMERSVFDLVDPELLAMPDGEGLVELFQRLIAIGRLASFEHVGANITFNTVSEKAQAEQALAHYHTLAEEQD